MRERERERERERGGERGKDKERKMVWFGWFGFYQPL